MDTSKTLHQLNFDPQIARSQGSMFPGRTLSVINTADNHTSLSLLGSPDKIRINLGKDKLADRRDIAAQGKNLSTGRHNMVRGNIIFGFQEHGSLPSLRRRTKLRERCDIRPTNNLYIGTIGKGRLNAGITGQIFFRQSKRRIISQITRIGNFSRNSGGNRHLRTAEINLVVLGPTACGKITRKGAQRNGISGRGLAHADASQTSGLMNPGAGMDQGQHVAPGCQILEDLAATGIDLKTHLRADLPVFQGFGNHH